jgi:anion-transporting  ArsA/GET3 family ATPase
VTASFTLFTRLITKILGGELLNDVASFVASLETMFGGFRERAEHTYELLKAPGTAFVVVAAPEPDALREASFFVDRLTAEQMPLAGVVINRVHFAAKGLTARAAEAAADRLAEQAPSEARPQRAAALAETALRVHADLAAAAESDRRMSRRFSAAHPSVPMTEVAALASDVHDLDGLRRIADLLAPPTS